VESESRHGRLRRQRTGPRDHPPAALLVAGECRDASQVHVGTGVLRVEHRGALECGAGVGRRLANERIHVE